MKTHIEDKPKSGIVRKPYTVEFSYRYGALCGVVFFDGDAKNSLTKPNTTPTCEVCNGINAERSRP